MGEKTSNERIFRKRIECVWLEGSLEGRAAGVFCADAVGVDDDLCREGAGKLAVNKAVHDKLSDYRVPRTYGLIPVQSETVRKMPAAKS